MPWLPSTLSFALALATFLALCGFWRRWQHRALPAVDAPRLVNERGRIVEAGLIAPFYVALNPLANALARLGCRPAWLTVAGLITSAVTAGTLLAGFWTLTLWLLLLHGVCDALDGAVARRRGCESRQGAHLDRVADIASETILLGTVAAVAVMHASAWMWPLAILMAIAVRANLRLAPNASDGKVPVLARRGWRLGAVGVILGFQISIEAVASVVTCPVFWPLPVGLTVLALGSSWGCFCWKRRLTLKRQTTTFESTNTFASPRAPTGQESPSSALVETP